MIYRKMQFANNYAISELSISEIKNQIEQLEDIESKAKKINEYIELVLDGKETAETKQLLIDLYDLLEIYTGMKGGEYAELVVKIPKGLRYKNRFRNLIKFEESKLPTWESLKAIFDKAENDAERIKLIKQWQKTLLDSENNSVVELLLLQIDKYVYEKSLTIK